MAGGSDMGSSAPTKICKRCKRKAPSGLTCVLCGRFLHPSCVDLLKSARITSAGELHCCEGDEVSGQEDVPQKSPALNSVSEDTCELPRMTEVLYLQEIIKQKDAVIATQREAILALKGQVDLLKIGVSSKSVEKNVNKRTTQPSSGLAIAAAAAVHRVESVAGSSGAGACVTTENNVVNGASQPEVSAKIASASELTAAVVSLPKPLGPASGNSDAASTSELIQPRQVSNAIHQAKAVVTVNEVLNLGKRRNRDRDVSECEVVNNNIGQNRAGAGEFGDDGFVKVVHKRRKGAGYIRNKPIVGTQCPTGAAVKAADELCFIHLYGLHVDTTTEDLRNYLLPLYPEVVIEALNSAHPELYSSFKISVYKRNREGIMKPEFWPAGVKINRFFLRRQRKGLVT